MMNPVGWVADKVWEAAMRRVLGDWDGHIMHSGDQEQS